jgi:arginine decarboxylase
MVMKMPTKYFITNGDSEGFTTLNAFDGALLKAGIGNTNLVRMSSICPPRASQIHSITLPQGSLVPVAYASITSMTPGDIISAGVAIAFPEDEDHAGLIMEYSSQGSRKEIQDMVTRMAEEGMKMRGKKIKELKSTAAEHIVVKCGCAFAAVVLWD